MYIRAYESQTFVLKGEIDGPGKVQLRGWGGAGSPKVNYMLDGPNTNFTGTLTVCTDEVRPAYHNFDNLFPTLYVLDGRNLGGRMPSFDPRTLTLTTLARLSMTNGNTVTLADGLNRGVYIKASGRFHVTGAGTLDVKWPLLLSGKMWKEGPDTLVLGGAMKHEAHDNGTLTDVPRAGSNLFEIVNGTVKIALTNALVTVKDSSAAAVRAMLPSLRPWKPYGLTSMVVPRANPGENTTTFLLVSKHTGVTIIFR